MSSGPSKQELDMYWKNSRQYFDELAKHYRETDPEYYNKYIAPYYANPFVSQPQFQTQSYGKQGSTAAGGGSKLFSVMIALVLLVAGMGAAAYFIMRSENYSNEHNRQIEKQTEQQKQNIEPVPEINKTAPEETPTTIEPSKEYQKGFEYFSKKEFDKAEEHLKKVSPDDPNYKNARKFLQFIRDNKESGRENYRRKPIERVR